MSIPVTCFHALPVTDCTSFVLSGNNVLQIIVCVIAVLITIANSNSDAVRRKETTACRGAGLSYCAAFERAGHVDNGSVDQRHKSKGDKSFLGEKHDVEIELVERKRKRCWPNCLVYTYDIGITGFIVIQDRRWQ